MAKIKRLLIISILMILLMIFFLLISSCQAQTENQSAASNQNQNEDKGDKTEMSNQVWMSAFQPWRLDALDEWAQTGAKLDVLCVFIDDVVKATDEELNQLHDMLDKTGIKLAVECAGICNWYANLYAPGNDDFAYNSVYGEGGEFTRLKRLIDMGIKISYLNIDHGILRGTNPDDTSELKMSGKEAAEQLFTAMKYWKKELPDIKFNYIVNFPNHGWKGEFAYNYQWDSDFFCGDFYEDFKEICRLNNENESGVKMNAVIADFPYNYAIGKMSTTFLKKDFNVKNYDWVGRILDLESETKTAGMKFGLIFNCDIAGYGKNVTAEKYCTDTLKYLDLYKSKGGLPDYNISESWYFLPDGTNIPKLLPESESYTMTNLTMEIIKKVKSED